MTNFEQIFTQIAPEEIGDQFNVFTLVGKDFFAITAGKPAQSNSMIGSGGGFGLLFRKPTKMPIRIGNLCLGKLHRFGYGKNNNKIIAL
jgi:hypothetical protein